MSSSPNPDSLMNKLSLSDSDSSDTIRAKPQSSSLDSPTLVERSSEDDELTAKDFVLHKPAQNEGYSTEMLKSHFKVDRLEYVNGGGFGTVYVGFDKAEPKCSIKVIKCQKPNDQIERARWNQDCQDEVTYLKLLKHDNFVSYHSHAKLDESHFVICTEYLDVDLHDLTNDEHLNRPLTFQETRHIGRQICAGLKFMHGLGVVHHDIKGNNIMLKLDPTDKTTNLFTSTVKIIDLGVAKKYVRRMQINNHRSGTTKYMSPQKSNFYLYDPFLADSYAFGIVLLELLMGQSKFWETFKFNLCPHKTIERFLNESHPFREVSEKDRRLLEAIKHLLAYNEEDRYTIEQVMQFFD